MTFTYTVSAADWGRIAPELVLAVTALLILLADLLLPQVGVPKGRSQSAGSTPANMLALPALSLLGLAGTLVATIVLYVAGDHQTAFNQMLGSDPGSLYAYIIILSASILGVILSPAYLQRLHIVHLGEYYSLMLLATIGMMLMAAATSFLMIFLGLEMLSLALYILCGFVTKRPGSQEASMKYFLLSSFASAFLLYGIALIYGATGSTTFSNIRVFLLQRVLTPPIVPTQPLAQQLLPFPTHMLLLIGLGLLTAGFAFKVSAIPFQAWTPDVYDGAPAPVTGFMSVATKAAALIAFARVFDVVLFPVRNDWLPVVEAIAILTIIGGNVLALAQTNVKRLLAYSSIAHAGYLLIGIVAGAGGLVTLGTNRAGIAAILFYLLCYTFMNLGAFGVVSVLERVDNSGNNLSDIRGLWYRQPVLAGLLAFFLFALAGFPFMAGFAAKFYIFQVALQSGHVELLVIGVLASILGMYYYLRPAAVMFMERETTTPALAGGASTAPITTGSGTKVSGKLRVTGGLKAGGTATAVATKAAVAVGGKTATAIGKESEQEPRIAWTTWIGLGIAVAGTLLMGTVLPFWLVDLAQQAAKMM